MIPGWTSLMSPLVLGPGGRAADITAEEEREIEANLRSLGYEE